MAAFSALADRWRRAAAVRNILTVALAIGTGSLDAIGFLALGNVFVSVMTGNLVLLGVGLGTGRTALAWHVALAIAGYAAGVAGGTMIAGRPVDGQPAWPPRVCGALLAELAVLCGFTAGWEAGAARPSGGAQFALLGTASLAMGLQSSAVDRLAVPGFSSTYLTSTLIRAVAQLVLGRRDHLTAKLAALACAIAGALGGALLIARAPRLAPAIAGVIVAGVLSTAWWLSRSGGLLTAAEDMPRGRDA